MGLKSKLRKIRTAQNGEIEKVKTELQTTKADLETAKVALKAVEDKTALIKGG